MVEPRVALARIRLVSVEAALAALSEQVQLRELEHRDAQLEIEAAKARIATADQRLAVAQALYRRAQDQARVAESESVDTKRLEQRTHLTQM